MQILDEVDRGRAHAHGVEQLIGDFFDPSAQILDPARRERFGYQPANAGVVGWIQIEDAPFPGGEVTGFDQARRARVEQVPAEPRVGQDRPDVVVPCYQPCLVTAGKHHS